MTVSTHSSDPLRASATRGGQRPALDGKKAWPSGVGRPGPGLAR
jgi:hypothetical protein